MQDIEGCCLMMCNTTDVVQSQSRSKRKISQVSKLVQLLFVCINWNTIQSP